MSKVGPDHWFKGARISEALPEIQILRKNVRRRKNSYVILARKKKLGRQNLTKPNNERGFAKFNVNMAGSFCAKFFDVRSVALSFVLSHSGNKPNARNEK